MPNKVAELYADFRVDFQQATLDVVNTTLGELRLSTLAEIGSLAGLTAALVKLGTSAVSTASNYHMLAQVYGLNTTSLQRMEVAGLAANVSIDKMQQSAVGLQQNLAGLNLGQINQGFLEAAGFFGLNVRPGTTEDDMMKQLFKKVPQFVKAHGPMGKAMASSLLGQMGVAPEMLQYIMAGKQFGAGATMNNPQIEALTKVNESLGELSRNLTFLAYGAIAPLVETLLPISQWMLAHTNAAHVHETVQAGKNVRDLLYGALHYESAQTQRMEAAQQLNMHKSALARIVGSAAPRLAPSSTPAAAVAAPGSSGKHETNIHVYGVEDHKIAKVVERAAKNAHEKTKRDNAMHTAINNSVSM